MKVSSNILHKTPEHEVEIGELGVGRLLGTASIRKGLMYLSTVERLQQPDYYDLKHSFLEMHLFDIYLT